MSVCTFDVWTRSHGGTRSLVRECWFGRKLVWLEKHVVGPCEVSINRRQFPVATYSVVQRPEVKLVYQPAASRRKVA
jgi:hypothetical protein